MRIGIVMASTGVAGAVEDVRRAADEGFELATFSNIFGLDAMTACAVAGSAVDGIELVTAVVPTYPRHPTAMAAQAISTHDACGGRFTLGVGLSHQVVIESMFGLSFDKPAKHMREYLAVLMPLLTEGSVSFAGEQYTVNSYLERPRGEGPDVLVAALGPVMLALAGASTAGTALWMTGPSTVERAIAPALRSAAEGAGRGEPRILASLPVCVTDDPAGARAKAAETFAVYATLPSYRRVLDAEGAAGPEDVALIGGEDEVLDALGRLEAAGATDFVGAGFGSNDEVARTRSTLRRWATGA